MHRFALHSADVSDSTIGQALVRALQVRWPGEDGKVIARRVNVNAATFSDWKRGKVIPRRSTVRRIAELANISLENLGVTSGVPQVGVQSPLSDRSVGEEAQPVSHAGKFQRLLQAAVGALEEDDARAVYFAMHRLLDEQYGRGLRSSRDRRESP